MSVFLYILLSLIFLRLLLAALNASYRAYLPSLRKVEDMPKLSILVHGDYELSKLLYWVEVLSTFDYSNLEVLIGVNNPQHQPMEELRYKALRDNRIEIVEIEQLQQGWHVRAQMNSILASKATGAYFLFIGAEVELRERVLEKAIAYMKARQLGFISILPVYIKQTFSEKVLLPIISHLYLTLFPIWLVPKLSWSRVALAFDGFMLFDASVYHQFQPFEQSRNHNHTSAIKAMRFLKSEGIRVACIVDDFRVLRRGRVTWRRCLPQVVHGVYNLLSRFTFFGLAYALLLSCWWIPFVIEQQWAMLVIGMLAISITQFILVRTTRIKTGFYIFYTLVQTFVQIFVMWVALIRVFKVKAHYKH